MTTFELTLFKGHAIIHEGDKVILIDTGAPSTIHESNRIEFLNKNYNCATNYMGLTPSKLSDMLGMKVTTLLGTDILSDFVAEFDYRNNTLAFHEAEPSFEGELVRLSNFMGVPVIELSIQNKNLKFFLDTGAKLSYLPEKITAGYQRVGIEQDFYPAIGEFETPCYEIPTDIGGQNFTAKYGNLPPILQMTLMIGGTDGIIGYDLFNNFKILLDLKKNTLKYG